MWTVVGGGGGGGGRDSGTASEHAAWAADWLTRATPGRQRDGRVTRMVRALTTVHITIFVCLTDRNVVRNVCMPGCYNYYAFFLVICII